MTLSSFFLSIFDAIELLNANGSARNFSKMLTYSVPNSATFCGSHIIKCASICFYPIKHGFIRLRQNTLQLAAGMNGGANAPKLEQRRRVGFGATWRAIAPESDGGFRFDTPQLAAGSFIRSASGAAFTTSPGSGCSVFRLLVLQDSPLAVFGRDLRNEEIVPSSF